MKSILRKVCVVVLVLLVLASSVLPAFALEWNGASSGGSGSSSVSKGDFYIPSVWADNPDTVFGLRFSFYNADSGETKGTTIDIFRDEYVDAGKKYDMEDCYMLTTKYNKLELKKLYNLYGYSLGPNAPRLDVVSDNCFSETDDGLTSKGLTALPEAMGDIETWQESNENIAALLAAMKVPGRFSVEDFEAGEYLLVEPLFPVSIAVEGGGAYCSLTVTEMAILGCDPNQNKISETYDGSERNTEGKSRYQYNWRWIAYYTNRYFPNTLYLNNSWVDSQGNPVLNTEAVPELTERASFSTIINNGYGIGIAYTNVEPTPGDDKLSFAVEYDLNIPLGAARDSVSVSFMGEEITGYTDKAFRFRKLTKQTYTFGFSYTNTLANVLDEAGWYVSWPGYVWTGKWNTEKDGSGKSLNWNIFNGQYTAEELAEKLGLDTTVDGQSILLYLEWEEVVEDNTYLFIDYVGNGATAGNGWTEIVGLADEDSYFLSSDSSAFSRIEEDASGVITPFKLVGWEIGGELYDFAGKVPFEDLVAESVSVSGREYPVVTIYASWDEFPVISAADRWFSLDEAQNGDITLEELMRTAEAIDGEIGDKTDFAGGEGSFTIIDYAAEEFKKFTTSGSVTVTYVAIDNAGSKVKCIVTVHVVDKDQTVPGSNEASTQYVRYISAKYYKQTNGEFVAEENGGVNENSVWRLLYEYEKLLTETFNNQQDPETGEWDSVYQTWVITKDQIDEIKEFVEEHGLGKTKSEDALANFYDRFLLGEP